MTRYLFERLTDKLEFVERFEKESKAEGKPASRKGNERDEVGRWRASDRGELVRANVQRLISSLRSSTHDQADVLSVRVPAVVDLDKDSTVHRQRMAEAVRDLILRFEPRLSEVKVSVCPQDNIMVPFSLSISACVVEEGEIERFQFTALSPE